MKIHITKNLLLSLALFTSSTSCLFAADWPMWGRDGSRNMVSDEKGITFDFSPGEMGDDEVVDMKTTKNVKWVAKLGSQAYGNVTIGNNRVFVGTNNESPRDEGKKRRPWRGDVP
jgi:hypothetical protein